MPETTNWNVVGCRTLIPVGVVLGDGTDTFTVPTLYDPISEEVFVINRRDHDIRQDVVAAVKAFISNQAHTMKESKLLDDPVDAKTWENIRLLTGLAKPPAQEI